MLSIFRIIFEVGDVVGFLGTNPRFGIPSPPGSSVRIDGNRPRRLIHRQTSDPHKPCVRTASPLLPKGEASAKGEEFQ